MGWGSFVLAFIAFFVSHSVPVRPPVKPWLVARLGHRGFTALYSAMSLAILAWLILATRQAPFVPLWDWAPWQPYVPLIAMLGVCVILCLTLGRPNPLSFGGSRQERFDPARPGLVRLTRHPLLLALAIWALAHLVPNGDLASVILFGTFAAFALMGGRIIDRRKRRDMGQDWERLVVALQATPVVDAVLACATLKRLVAGVLLWLALIALHPVVLGVNPLPW